MENNRSAQRVAIVTGASGGIGREVALRLSAEGFAVVIGYHHGEDVAHSVCSAIEARGGAAVAVKADLAAESGASQLFGVARERFGGVDVVFNNAGVVGTGPIATLAASDYDRLFDVNVRGALMVLQQAAMHLRDGGRIVNTSSTIVGAPIAGSALYSASKAALEAFGRVLSKELGARGVTVNNVRLGPVVPGMFSKAPPERQAAMAAASPFKRLGTPQDVADVVAFLVGEQGGWVTGQTLTVDGGAT
ncbi:SDR family oxidoreductase [Burkholderia sp. AU30280]|uniref:SDR family oxidoreductase n=1 Tax=Burkholderia sp. AU30280 TaxID=2879628 RepID=UPI001CF39388|nr:SDR family oxidoreductase [Burkholderia sp. AU30280]MCA8277172.1 SDR family oxidoreductase [Burkholderia sp. AU30280]